MADPLMIDLNAADPDTPRLLEAGLYLAKHLAYASALRYYPTQADMTNALELWAHVDQPTRHLWRVRAMEFIKTMNPQPIVGREIVHLLRADNLVAMVRPQTKEPPEPALCIYCTGSAVDPEFDPFCSAICSINAANEGA